MLAATLVLANPAVIASDGKHSSDRSVFVQLADDTSAGQDHIAGRFAALRTKRPRHGQLPMLSVREWTTFQKPFTRGER